MTCDHRKLGPNEQVAPPINARELGRFAAVPSTRFVGHCVKVMLPTSGWATSSGQRIERVWVEIDGTTSDGACTGVLANKPVGVSSVTFGDRMTVRPSEVLEVTPPLPPIADSEAP